LTWPNRSATLDDLAENNSIESTMPKLLGEDHVAAYRERGYHFRSMR